MAARKKKRGNLSHGIVPYYTGKEQHEILPKALLDAARGIRRGFSVIYPSIKKEKKRKR